MSNNVFFLNTILLGGSAIEVKLSAADDLKAQDPNQATRSAMTAFQSVVAKSMATNEPSQVA